MAANFKLSKQTLFTNPYHIIGMHSFHYRSRLAVWMGGVFKKKHEQDQQDKKDVQDKDGRSLRTKPDRIDRI